MSKFEDQLFADLMQEHGSELIGMSRPAARCAAVPRAVWAVAAVIGIAGAITAGMAILGGNTPAYAVIKADDGLVTVSIAEISGIAGANAKLRELGVPAAAVPMREGCPDPKLATNAPNQNDAGWDVTWPGQGGKIIFDSRSIPAGDTVVLGAWDSKGHVALSYLMVSGPAPSCVPLLPLSTSASVSRHGAPAASK